MRSRVLSFLGFSVLVVTACTHAQLPDQDRRSVISRSAARGLSRVVEPGPPCRLEQPPQYPLVQHVTVIALGLVGDERYLFAVLPANGDLRHPRDYCFVQFPPSLDGSPPVFFLTDYLPNRILVMSYSEELDGGGMSAPRGILLDDRSVSTYDVTCPATNVPGLTTCIYTMR